MCGEQVIARQGDVREHHFAHSSNAQPCASSYESDLHRFAKRVIVEAGGLVVPVNAAAARALGLGDDEGPRILLACTRIEEEVVLGDRRPDPLAATTAGVSVYPIEIAYSSFCDLQKRKDYDDYAEAAGTGNRPWGLHAYGLRRRPGQARAARGHRLQELALAQSGWRPPSQAQSRRPPRHGRGPCPHRSASSCPRRSSSSAVAGSRLQQLPSGDIAIKAVRYDPDVVSVVRTIARQHFGQYRGTYFSWVIPRFRAEAARAQLRAIAAGV